jgi:hypothetical protein
MTELPDLENEANPRAVMGDNNPPLAERVLFDFDEALRSHDGLIERIDAMVTKADTAKPCTSDDLAGRYGDFIKMTATAVKTIEAEREKQNRPMLDAQKGLMARARYYSDRAAAAGAKVRALLDTYLAEQKRLADIEEARVREVARLAEVERQRIIREREIETARLAEVERKRLQDIADEEARVEQARLQKIEDERAAKEKREAAAVEVKAEVVEVEAVVEEERWEPPVFVPTARPKQAPLRGDYGTAVSTTTTWHVAVENVRQIPNAYLLHPTVIAALEKVIGPQIRGANGLRVIKGCRIWSTVGSAVR